MDPELANAVSAVIDGSSGWRRKHHYGEPWLGCNCWQHLL